MSVFPCEVWSLVLKQLPLTTVAKGVNLLSQQFAELLRFCQMDLFNLASFYMTVPLLQLALREPLELAQLPYSADYYLTCAVVMGRFEYAQCFWDHFQPTLNETDRSMMVSSAIIIEHYDMAYWLLQRQGPLASQLAHLYILEFKGSTSESAVRLHELLLEHFLVGREPETPAPP